MSQGLCPKHFYPMTLCRNKHFFNDKTLLLLPHTFNMLKSNSTVQQNNKHHKKVSGALKYSAIKFRVWHIHVLAVKAFENGHALSPLTPRNHPDFGKTFVPRIPSLLAEATLGVLKCGSETHLQWTTTGPTAWRLAWDAFRTKVSTGSESSGTPMSGH